MQNMLLPATAVDHVNSLARRATRSKRAGATVSFRVGGTHTTFQDRRTTEYGHVLALLVAGHSVVVRHGSYTYTAVLTAGDVGWVRTAAKRCRRNYTRVLVGL